MTLASESLNFNKLAHELARAQAEKRALEPELQEVKSEHRAVRECFDEVAAIM